MLSEGDKTQAVAEARTGIRENFDFLTNHSDTPEHIRRKSIKEFNKHFMKLIEGLGLSSFETVNLIDLTPVNLEKPCKLPTVISKIYSDYDYLMQNKETDLKERKKTTFRFNQGFHGLIRGSGMTPFQVVTFMRVEMQNQNLLQSAS